MSAFRLGLAQRQRDEPLRIAVEEAHRKAREEAAVRRAVDASLADARRAAEEEAAFLRAVKESKKVALDKRLAQEAADRDFARRIASEFSAAGNPALAAAAGAGHGILFKVIRNEGGGDCAFRAVAQGMGHGEEFHARLRRWYANFVGDPTMRQLGKWMEGCWENMARLVGRPIYVYDGRAIRLYQDGGDTIFDLSKAGGKNITMRFVPPEVAGKEVMHIRWNGCHFELLERR